MYLYNIGNFGSNTYFLLFSNNSFDFLVLALDLYMGFVFVSEICVGAIRTAPIVPTEYMS